ncbi:MAG: response regulator [Deltaproteobacteria bacterium]|nr:response regulator [Deltaproteobacteria bacterium]
MITRDAKNIFVVDDSIFFRTKLSDILVEAGHKVRFAKDGREVINELKIDSDNIDLLILDLQMPEIDGFGVLRWLKENGYAGRFPVLVVTSVYEPGHVMETLRNLGATGLMTKGFTPEQIIFRVNRILFPGKTTNRSPKVRVPVSMPVDFTIGDKTLTGFVLNISETGIFLHTRADILTGAVMHIKFTLPGTPRLFDLKAVVKWSTADIDRNTLFGGFGIMFTSLTQEEQDDLKRFIDSELKRLGVEDVA